MREKLIDLLEQAEGTVNNARPSLEQIADYLIANGVTVSANKRITSQNIKRRILDALAGMAAVLLGAQRAVIIDAIHMIEQMEVGE